MPVKIEEIALMDLGDVNEVQLSNTLHSNLTVIAQIGTPALKVADLYVEGPPGGVIVVVSVSKEPLGILNPKWMVEEFRKNFRSRTNVLRHPPTLRDVVLAYESLDQRAWRSTLHDLTTQYLRRPAKIYCIPGKHFGDGNPCSEHSHSTP